MPSNASMYWRLPPHPVAVLDVDLLALRPVEEPALLRFGQLGPRLRRVDFVAIGDRLADRLVETRRAAHRPGHERAVVDRERRIGDDEVRVDLLLRAEPRAARARAVRRVEREDARLQLRQRHAVIRTREVLREEHLLAVDDVDHDEPLAEPERRLDRLRQPQAKVGLHDEPVDDDVDLVLELLVELGDAVVEHDLPSVDLRAREAFADQLLEDVLVLALAVAHERRVDREPRALIEPQHLVDDRVDRLAGDRLAADRTVRPAHPRVEQPEIVVDLGHRADGRTRVARRRLLVDRDRRAEAVDVVDVRLLHHLEELPGVRGERLDVAALSLRIDRVEGKARLPGAREPGDADEAIPRQPDGDVLQVVLAGAVDNQLVGSHSEPFYYANVCSGRVPASDSRNRFDPCCVDLSDALSQQHGPRPVADRGPSRTRRGRTPRRRRRRRRRRPRPRRRSSSTC